MKKIIQIGLRIRFDQREGGERVCGRDGERGRVRGRVSPLYNYVQNSRRK